MSPLPTPPIIVEWIICWTIGSSARPRIDVGLLREAGNPLSPNGVRESGTCRGSEVEANYLGIGIKTSASVKLIAETHLFEDFMNLSDLFIRLDYGSFHYHARRIMEGETEDPTGGWTGFGTLMNKKVFTWSFVTGILAFTTEEVANWRVLGGAGAGAEAWFFLSKSNARTISLSSATSDETAWVEEFVLTLATTALARV
ncbi:hypothetical protein Tco_0531349 [Tanacetum coccineum]